MSCATFRPTPAMKSRQVRPNRAITGKRGVPYCGCPKTGNQAGRGFPSRAHARLRHLIGPRSSRSCCQPTPLQRTASLAGRAPCGRGRRTPSASARGQRSTTSAWIAPACVVSVVWRYRRPQGGQGNAELPGPRKQDDEATAAHKGPAAIVSSRRKILACGMRRSSGPLNKVPEYLENGDGATRAF